MKCLKFLKKTAASDNGGFTLLESLFALFIFTVGILAVVKLQASSIDANGLARHNTEAASVAASVVESLRPLNYQEDLELTEGAHALPGQGQYTVAYTVQRDAMIENTMLIQVTVTWMERGRPKTVNLVSIKPDII